ncbi:hypothetical protein ACNPNN_13180 [Stenotrophomonas geniculata]|uniref:hypothetical protein n=1 Tax=Stenotrophomonas geniculata TaxID=86188 RepID=UPI003AAE286D
MGYDALGPGLAGATKEMVMSYPADAFARARPAEAPEGGLVFLRGMWTFNAVAGTAEMPKRKSLILTGPEAGRVYDALLNQGLSTAPGVEVEIRIPDPTTRVDDGRAPAPRAVVVPADGKPEFWGHHPNSEFERYGFKLDGSLVPGEEHEHVPFVYFTHYEVWLKRDGKLLSDKPLFVVGA